MAELYGLIALTKKKTTSANQNDLDKLESNAAADENDDDDNNTNNNNKKLNAAEARLLKKDHEKIYKQIEGLLFNVLNESKDPFWLNLILIENSRDYPFQRYNSLACTIAKLFEKWCSLDSNQALVKNYKLDEDIKISSFVMSTRYHLLMIDSIFKTYQLTTNNEFLLPFMNLVLVKLDEKDKAILISSCMLHDHFKFDEVWLYNCLINVKSN